MLHSQTSPHDMVEKMGRGINIGNVLSAPAEGNWSPAVTEQYFIDVATAGFTNVRIPIDFFGYRTNGDTSFYSSDAGTAAEYTGTSNDYVVLNTYLDRIEQVINWSLDQDLVTILDFHGSTLKPEFVYTFNEAKLEEYTEPTSAKRAADNEKFRAIWTQVATRFKDHSENLLFEVINEPYFNMSAAEMDTLNSHIISIIRTTESNNTTRNIIITGGTDTSHEAPLRISPSIISTDSYLIASFHYYQPFSFTNSSTENYNVFNWGTPAEKATLTSRFDEVKSWSETYNIPVTLGEFGADNENGLRYDTGVYGDFDGPVSADRIDYHRYVAEQAINRGFSFSAWDAGNKSNKAINLRTDNPGVSNAISGPWVEEVKDALLELGTWPLCYGPTNSIISNPNFECGYNTDWGLVVSGSASATFSDATTDSKSGDAGAKIVVTSSDVFNKVILSNTIYTEDLSGKKITFRVSAKSLNGGQSFKMRVKLNDETTFNISPAFTLTNNYDFFEFECLVPNLTTSIQLQVLVGEDQGTYFFDDFEPATGFEYTKTTWLGTTDTDWETNTNWDLGVPVSSSHAFIPSDLSVYPVVSETTSAVVNNLIIDATATLSVASGGSLIVSGTSSGNVTYNRNLATTNWYLVSSPVVGETYDNTYVTDNGIALGADNNRGIASYTTSVDSWDYMQAGASAATFSAGTGYSVKRSTAGDISFTGTLNVADAGVDVDLDATGNGFNLLGNPYTSHIASATFLTDNSAVSETQTLWVWNLATGAYEVKTRGDAMVIAPAQGFFVKANGTGSTFNFTESNQAGSGGAFQRTETRPEIYLTLSDQTDAREAKIYYIENMTTGFDVGYEGELFNGVSNPLAIYTHLIADSQGKNYQVQSLPPNNFENMIIPVGVNANAGTSITIDASTNNFPEGMNIYLEDKQDNSFTLLEADANFSTTLENSLSGIGRFYLHTTSTSLSVNDLTTSNNLSIYNTNRENLRIAGVQNGTATIQLYNILGKEVLRTSFEGKGVNDITLPNLANGVYIIKLAIENGIINKKIIIQ
jgi:endoglucanase